MRCKLGNVETTTLETIALLQDGSTVFNESWSSGTASVPDGSINMTYTAEEIFVNIAQVQCNHVAVYTILVNELLSDNTTVLIESRYSNLTLFEPRRQKTGLRGFRPGPTQTELYSHRRCLET